VTFKTTLQHAIVTISSASADMSSAELRFFINGGYGHVNTGNVYVTNIRFYKQGASQAAYMYKGQYFDAGSGLDTTYFTAFWNAASNTIKAVPGQTGTTNVLTLKGSLTACALTAPMVLSLNTDYVVEFDYWSDGDGRYDYR